MPRVTGLQLIAQMRSAGMLTPVILISGAMPTEELNQRPGLRVDAMLDKPFAVDTLSDAVRKVLPASGRAAIAKGNPFSRTAEPASASARGEKNSAGHILVVDDDRESRQFTIDLLAGSGYQVDAADDGAAGWEALQTADYDLVITDNRMPRMTGLEMIEKLHFSRMTIPVIMATGHVPTDEFARKPWLTPEVTLEKPFTNGELLAAISNVLGPGGNEHHQAPPPPKISLFV
jgi:DNA-binding response OmpR family regulator